MSTPYPAVPPPDRRSLFKPSEHVGALVRVFVTDFDEESSTPFGVRPEALVDIDIIDDPDRRSVGEHYEALRLSGKILAPQLGNVVGQEVFGRLAAWQGRNANPAIYLDMLRDGDGELIDRWRAEQKGSRVSERDVRPPMSDAERYNQHPPRQSSAPMPPPYPPARSGQDDPAPF